MLKQMFITAMLFVATMAYAETVRPAYYVAEFQPTDREGIKAYSAQVESTFKPYSGRFIVRGGEADVKEGFGVQGRLVIIKFDSLKQAQEWYNSSAYQKIIPIRQRSGNSRTYIVEGLPDNNSK
ncbi:DUF1330 domain-containing protein [[Mannheimia] succiniciproducens]|uniref:DUF1330 domain-containing protein n=1 Tax=Mannheimia succiniciproducens (strain KCTC 0769BP / MBEL55E) TaxID=221988 RepID=Q65SN3_MANSM|nr:DUF1330 domain-containing protein [[Mannheimia] succiniciproducens]AAU38027.1 unknown [[Mannheimia] succiniciproducens MBEL55E]